MFEESGIEKPRTNKDGKNRFDVFPPLTLFVPTLLPLPKHLFVLAKRVVPFFNRNTPAHCIVAMGWGVRQA
jgi:hypothetical protein